MFSIFLQLDKWEYENIQMNQKLLANVGLFKIIFLNEHGDVLFLLA